MSDAIHETDMEPVIIEDLVRFGYDEGVREGKQRGLDEGSRAAADVALARLVQLLEQRGLKLSSDETRTIEAELSLPRLIDWISRVNLAKDVEELLSG